MLPNALAVGMTYREFMHSTPKIINAYFEAHKIRQKMIDEILWQNGLYTEKAFEVVMSHFGAGLVGKKSQAQYIEKPFLQQVVEKDEELSEEELQRQRELFVMKLRMMKANFDLNHPKNNGGGEKDGIYEQPAGDDEEPVSQQGDTEKAHD